MPRYDLPQALVNAKLKQNKTKKEKNILMWLQGVGNV